MPKGLRLPLETGVRGGARTIEDSAARRQNVLLGITPASSLHPWHQKLTPSEEVIFNIADEMTGGQLVSHIYDFFDEQERLGLTMLPRNENSVKLSLDNVDKGEVEMVINYLDLEDNQNREVRVTNGRRR